MSHKRCHGMLFACSLAVAIAGCGDGMGLTNVSGVVTLDGKPVPDATVTFIPKGETESSPSYGTTDAGGYYSLMFSRDREGVMPGTYDVTIETEKMPPSDIKAMKADGLEVPEYVPVPTKYSQAGAITKQVEPDGGEINLELTST